MIGQEDRVLQRLLHNTSRIERMKTFAMVLQDQHVRLVIDHGDRMAKTSLFRSKTTVTTVSVVIMDRLFCSLLGKHSLLLTLGLGNRRQEDLYAEGR